MDGSVAAPHDHLFHCWSELEARAEDLVRGGSYSSVTSVHQLLSAAAPAVRVTLMCGVVEKVVCRNRYDSLVELRDRTGSITCCVHSDVLQRFPMILQPATGVILREATVLKFGQSPHIIVCLRNVHTIFELRDDGDANNDVGPCVEAPAQSLPSAPSTGHELIDFLNDAEDATFPEYIQL